MTPVLVLSMYAKSLPSCPNLCNPMDCRPSGSSVHWILQARILDWVEVPSSSGSSQPRDWTWVSCVSCTGSWVLYYEHHLGSLSPKYMTKQNTNIIPHKLAYDSSLNHYLLFKDVTETKQMHINWQMSKH